jgi:ABC-type multidrug transport system fused ATPase/permease subunit
MGKDGATKSDVVEAATMVCAFMMWSIASLALSDDAQAHAHEFIDSFPNSYDTQIGDNGSQLSGGQRCIASIVIRARQDSWGRAGCVLPSRAC